MGWEGAAASRCARSEPRRAAPPLPPSDVSATRDPHCSRRATMSLLVAVALLAHARFCLASPAELRASLRRLPDFEKAFDVVSSAEFVEQGGVNDPTHGTVEYKNAADAKAMNLYHGSMRSGVVLRAKPQGSGKPPASVRIQSRMSLAGGIVVADIKHAPWGCSVWPAFWMAHELVLGTDHPWPYGGEIDILEHVHNATRNAQTLHTLGGCQALQNGQDCEGQGAGCGVLGPEGGYGKPFNEGTGGWYVAEFDTRADAADKFIKIWYVPRLPETAVAERKLAAAVRGGSPLDPSALFAAHPELLVVTFSLADGVCGVYEDSDGNPARYFRNQRIVINITFCGDWAGNVFDEFCMKDSPSPGSSMDHCNAFLADQQSNNAFWSEVYFAFNSLSIYQSDAQHAASEWPSSGLGEEL